MVEYYKYIDDNDYVLYVGTPGSKNTIAILGSNTISVIIYVQTVAGYPVRLRNYS